MSTNGMNQREKDIYMQYQTVIAYFIAEIEVRDTEYPIEVFNEIRAIFTHLSRFKLQNSESDLVSAERHVKRAILDCFKYMCVSYAEELKEFRHTYRNVDLKIADNGRFLPKLDNLENEARNTYIFAKKAEIKKEISEKDIYHMFEESYNMYKKVIDFLRDSNEAILFASSHSKNSNIINIVSIVVTIISIAIAIISFI